MEDEPAYPELGAMLMHFPAYDEALRYLDAGLSFYPALPRDKQPNMRLLPKRWSEAEQRDLPTWAVFRDRQPTRDECRDWFMRKPTPNIVLITGRPSGVIVVDFDSADALDMFRAHYRGEPTPCVASNRGEHYYFAYEPHDLQYDALPGCEILSDGRCCTMPPSVHASGHIYRWGKDADLSKSLQPLPDWILEAAKKKPRPLPVAQPLPRNSPRYAIAAMQGELDSLALVTERRNQSVYTAALKLSKFVSDLGRENVVSALESAAVALGLPLSEARQAVRSGINTGLNKAA